MTALSGVAAIAWVGSALLMLLGLVRSRSELALRLGIGGMALAIGASLYTHDVVNLPEMVSLAALGAGIGYLVVRWPTIRSVLPILALLLLPIGLCLLLTALAIDRNPIAFDILRPDDATLASLSWWLLTGAELIGAAMAIAAAPLCRAVSGGRRGVERWLAALAGLAGWGGLAIALLLNEPGMAVIATIVGAGGFTLCAMPVRARGD